MPRKVLWAQPECPRSPLSLCPRAHPECSLPHHCQANALEVLRLRSAITQISSQRAGLGASAAKHSKSKHFNLKWVLDQKQITWKIYTKSAHQSSKTIKIFNWLSQNVWRCEAKHDYALTLKTTCYYLNKKINSEFNRKKESRCKGLLCGFITRRNKTILQR